jgi:hypothetical protein
MSSPKQPSGPPLPKLIDPNNVQDTPTFANHLVGLGCKDGVWHLTFSHIRPKHSNNGTATDENVLIACISVTAPVMTMLAQGFEQLNAAMQLQNATLNLN